ISRKQVEYLALMANVEDMELAGDSRDAINDQRWFAHRVLDGAQPADRTATQEDTDRIYRPYLAAIRTLTDVAKLDRASLVYKSSTRAANGYDIVFEAQGRTYKVWSRADGHLVLFKNLLYLYEERSPTPTA